jgi:signal transduction histidine kinase
MVAHDIHDGLTQDVVGAHMALQGVGEQNADEAGYARVQRAEQLLTAAIKECRRMIRDLRPMILDEAGVVDAIEHQVAEENTRAGLTVAFRHDVRFTRLDPKLEGAIFRIVQEAISNVRRHGQTEHAAVELIQDNGALEIVVRDRGVGFDPNQVSAECFGLRGIRERARLFGGEAEITSTPGDGATVYARLPIDDASAE